jgi:hypothetical protein
MVTGSVNLESWEETQNRIRFWLRSALQVWGLQGMASLALVCGIVAFAVLWIMPAARRLADIEANSAAHSATPIRPTAITPTTATGALFDFYKSFPPESLILAITDQLSQAADHSGMHITQADYRANQDLSGLTRYEVSLAARGTYPQLRSFTAATLTDFPTLSLDGLSLSRSSVTDSAIDAQFRFSIYLRPN